MACQLVTPRQVVHGQLRVASLQLRFLGDAPAPDAQHKARTDVHNLSSLQ